MRTRWVLLLSTVMLAGALLLAPVSGQARAVKLKDHCVVEHISRGVSITACYPT